MAPHGNVLTKVFESIAVMGDSTMNPLMRMYDFHKREFGLADNRFLRLFEELLSKQPCSILECSVRISSKDVHAGRLRLGYEQRDVHRGLDKVYRFLDKTADCDHVRLNRSVLYGIIDKGFDLSRTMAMGVGLDYRSNTSNSKVKCYFMIKGHPEKVDEVVSLHMPMEDMEGYLIHDEFMFGIEMYLDGRTNVEIYPFLDPQDFRDVALMEKLRLRYLGGRLLGECNLLHISFDSFGRRLLHFHPQSPPRFVRLIGNRQLSLLYASVQILDVLLTRPYKIGPLCVNLCLVEDEIVSDNIRNIGLQYGLTYRAGEGL